MKVISLVKAKVDIQGLLDEAMASPVTIKSPKGDAVVMSRDHYRGLIETLHLIKTPENAEHLRKSITQYATGQSQTCRPIR